MFRGTVEMINGKTKKKEKIFMQISRYVKVIVSDFNVQIGKEEYHRKTQ